MFSLVKNNDSNLRFENSKMELSHVNDLFIKFINDNGISCVNLTSVGNSIATGYSINDSIKPLLLRNTDLINKCNFKLNLRAYARAQDNNDEHIYDWLINNVKQSDINKKVQLDFTSNRGMPHDNINNSDVIKYYPIDINDDIGLGDLVRQRNDGLANIIIYNGTTGSFLDNITRHGMHKGLYGFERDYVSLESNLKYIYLTNPYTQVYVCGIPNIAGVGLTNFVINRKIAKICKNYPNCVYVDPVKQNFLYRKNDNLVIDVHYSDDEYLKLNHVVLEAIINNYFPVKALVDFDIAMKQYSDVSEYGDKPNINEIINGVFSKYDLNSEQLKKIIKYFKERYSYDFYYTPRKEVLVDINSRKSK